MRIEIREALGEDRAAVEDVLRRSFAPLMAQAYDAGLLARALPLMTRAHPRLLGSGTYFLAEADGRAVGCGGWSLTAPGRDRIEPGVAHIRHFATAADFTGRGVGRRLYERCETQARAAGIARFECYSSRNGEGFYASLGFRRIALIGVAMGPDLLFPSIHMKRDLASPLQGRGRATRSGAKERGSRT